MGIRYIGGCCGFQPYHIRAVTEALSDVRGRDYPACKKYDANFDSLKMHTKPWVRARANREYWDNLKASSGRP